MMRCECWRGLRVGHSPSFDLSIDVQKPFEEWLGCEAAGVVNTKVDALPIRMIVQLVPNVRQQSTIGGKKNNVSPATHEKRSSETSANGLGGPEVAAIFSSESLLCSRQ